MAAPLRCALSQREHKPSSRQSAAFRDQTSTCQRRMRLPPDQAALCRFVWNPTTSICRRRAKRMSGQVLPLGNSQVLSGEEIGRRAEAFSCPLGLLLQAVHRFNEGVGTVVGHSSEDGIGALADRLGQLPEGLEPTALGPAQPGGQIRPRAVRVVALWRPRVHFAQRHLHPPRARDFQTRALQPVHRVELRLRPAARVPAHHHNRSLMVLRPLGPSALTPACGSSRSSAWHTLAIAWLAIATTW